MVLVATIRALKMNGGVAKDQLGSEDIGAVTRGCANLGRHIENLRGFGLPLVVALNHFNGDTAAEIAALQDYCARHGVIAIPCHHWAQGGAGAEDLATPVALMEDIRVHIAGSELVILPDAAHILAIEQADRVNRHLLGFLGAAVSA